MIFNAGCLLKRLVCALVTSFEMTLRGYVKKLQDWHLKSLWKLVRDTLHIASLCYNAMGIFDRDPTAYDHKPGSRSSKSYALSIP